MIEYIGHRVVTVLLIYSTTLSILIHAQLHKNIRYYETIHADDFSHKVVKRGTNKNSYHPYNIIKEVEFQTLGRNFRLILHPHKEVLHSHFQAYAMDGYGNQSVVHFGNRLQLPSFVYGNEPKKSNVGGRPKKDNFDELSRTQKFHRVAELSVHGVEKLLLASAKAARESMQCN